MSPASHRRCKALDLPVSPIHVRAIRIDKGNGRTEVILASLFDTELYPADTFKELYHLRWTIEESCKTAKCRVELENFSGKTVESVYKNFFAKVFTLNLTSALTHSAQDAIDQDAHQKNIRTVSILRGPFPIGLVEHILETTMPRKRGLLHVTNTSVKSTTLTTMF